MEFTGWRYWTLVVGGVLAILLVVADFVLLQGNTTRQAEVNQRQQFINQSIALGRVENTLVRAIAIAATRHTDTQLADVLRQEGIRIRVAPPAAPPGPASTPPTAAHKGAKP